jgi:hypothetical protein
MASSSSTFINNWDGKSEVPPSTNQYMDVTCPLDGTVIGQVAVSGTADVEAAVQRANVSEDTVGGKYIYISFSYYLSCQWSP